VTPDQIFGCVAVAAMLMLAVSRLSNDPTPTKLKWRMALIWVAIVALIAAIVLVAQRGGG